MNNHVFFSDFLPIRIKNFCRATFIEGSVVTPEDKTNAELMSDDSAFTLKHVTGLLAAVRTYRILKKRNVLLREHVKFLAEEYQNRMWRLEAAQSANSRLNIHCEEKKAQIKDLKKENKQLRQECHLLQERNNRLEKGYRMGDKKSEYEDGVAL